MQNLQIVEKIRGIAEQHKKSISAVAIRWILDYVPKSVVLTGVKNKSQVDENVEALGWHLSEEELALLERISKE